MTMSPADGRQLLTIGTEVDDDATGILRQLGARDIDWARRFPQGSDADTVLGDCPLHAAEISFISKQEILAVLMHPDEFRESLRGRGDPIPYGTTMDGKTVMKQPGWRACGETCAAMLMMDHGVKPRTQWLEEANLSNEESLSRALERVGFRVNSFRFELGPFDFQSRSGRRAIGRKLQKLVKQGGPGILSIGGEIGGHFVVLESLSMENNTAIIRDPFHGWRILVTAEAVYNRGPQSLLQIVT